MIKTPTDRFYIQPLHKTITKEIHNEPHILKRMNDNEVDLDFAESSGASYRRLKRALNEDNRVTCGTDGKGFICYLFARINSVISKA